ncbi:hypothetical protein M0804_003200 [Polistes exclamans]|nr:hypothetical protein M0804_003200 [Polistes exclamans]
MVKEQRNEERFGREVVRRRESRRRDANDDDDDDDDNEKKEEKEEERRGVAVNHDATKERRKSGDKRSSPGALEKSLLVEGKKNLGVASFSSGRRDPEKNPYQSREETEGVRAEGVRAEGVRVDVDVDVDDVEGAATRFVL